MKLRATIVSILLLTACEPPPPDVDGPLRFAIRAETKNTHVTRQGEIDDVPDLSGVTLAIHSPNGAGGFEVKEGVQDEDGSVEIPEVLSGPYYFQIDKQYIYTKDIFPDFGETLLGRPDTSASKLSPTDLVFDLDGLSPWQLYDEIQVIASDVGEAYLRADADLRSSPSDGATRLSTSRLDWTGRNLIQGSAGDRLAIAQLVSTSSPNGWNYRRLERIVETESFEQSDGSETRISGSFSEVPLDSSVPLDWKKSQFTAFGSDVHARAEASYEKLAVFVLPRAAEFGTYGNSPDLFFMLHSAEGVDIMDTFTFGNPYPENWDKVVQAGTRFKVDYSTGDAEPATLVGGFWYEDLLSEVVGKPIRPTLTTVRNIRINGSPANVDLGNVGATPTIAWDEPSVGEPSGYYVHALRLADLGGRTDFEHVATFQTDETELQIPPGALDPFGIYVFIVGALQRPSTQRYTSSPFRYGYPFAVAEALTEKVKP